MYRGRCEKMDNKFFDEMIDAIPKGVIQLGGFIILVGVVVFHPENTIELMILGFVMTGWRYKSYVR